MKAFPLSNMTGLNQQGMDLRDYFAAQAMQAVLSNAELLALVATAEELGQCSSARCATVAYRYADAMMEVRKENHE